MRLSAAGAAGAGFELIYATEQPAGALKASHLAHRRHRPRCQRFLPIIGGSMLWAYRE